MIANIPLYGQIVSDLILIIADRDNLPFHHKFGTITAIVNGLAMKQPAGLNVGIQLFYHFFIRVRPLQNRGRLTHDFMWPVTGQFAKCQVYIDNRIALAGFGDDDVQSPCSGDGLLVEVDGLSATERVQGLSIDADDLVQVFRRLEPACL